MIYSDYYQDYRGPELTKVILNDKENITDLVKPFYGKDHNWGGKLWTYKEVFGDDCEGNKFYCEFFSDDQRKHWFYGYISHKEAYFNVSLHTPMSQV